MRTFAQPAAKTPARAAARESQPIRRSEPARATYRFDQMRIRPAAMPAARGFMADEQSPLPEPPRNQIAVGQDVPAAEAGPAPDAAAPEAAAPEAAAPEAEAAAPAEEAAPEAEAPAEGGAAAPLEVTSRTAAHAPDGTGDDRPTIGTCEDVHFAVGGRRANWTSDVGWPRARENVDDFFWAAPEQPGPATITATIPDTGETASITMDVIAPNEIKMVRDSVDTTIPAGTAGALMFLVVHIHPKSVNFGWAEMLEEARPASGVSGYFATLQAGGADLDHHPNPDFVRIRWNNTIRFDTAGIRGGVLPAPWSAGGFYWVIPNRYRCASSTGNGRRFFTTYQRFRIAANGRVTVTKAGASYGRTP